ncbi:MAG: efflux pump rane protein [Verrucomicrobiaceae bacterium]|nr:efflux pump rane protein [Verrucomicrobiaceae bacterium]
MSDTTPATNGNKQKRQRALLLLLVVVIIAAIIFAIYWMLSGRYHESTDDAYVAGNLVQITPQVPGTVISIGADETDSVHLGEVLIALNPADAKIALERSQAELGEAVRQVQKLFLGVGQFEAGVVMGEAGLVRAQLDSQRRAGMDTAGAVSREDLEHSQQLTTFAEAGLVLAQSQLDSSRALTTKTDVAHHPQVLAAAAHVRDAYLALQRTKIPSPVNGYVAKRAVQVGQRVMPGETLIAVVPLDQFWIDANFKEVQVRHLRLGQPVKVTADIYGDNIEYDGKIAGLGMGTGAAFSLLPAQNATGNWIKVVQRLPIRVELDPEQLRKHPLRIGLSMQVSVDTHNRDGAVLASKSRTEPAFSTTVYDAEAHEADALIAKIIADNLLDKTSTPTMPSNSRRHKKH